jgi:hypothetical protein
METIHPDMFGLVANFFTVRDAIATKRVSRHLRSLVHDHQFLFEHGKANDGSNALTTMAWSQAPDAFLAWLIANSHPSYVMTYDPWLSMDVPTPCISTFVVEILASRGCKSSAEAVFDVLLSHKTCPSTVQSQLYSMASAAVNFEQADLLRWVIAELAPFPMHTNSMDELVFSALCSGSFPCVQAVRPIIRDGLHCSPRTIVAILGHDIRFIEACAQAIPTIVSCMDVTVFMASMAVAKPNANEIARLFGLEDMYARLCAMFSKPNRRIWSRTARHLRLTTSEDPWAIIASHVLFFAVPVHPDFIRFLQNEIGHYDIAAMMQHHAVRVTV